MKRKITELEQKLLDKGWKLECKTYWGKHSQKVDTYEFYKEIVVDISELSPKPIRFPAKLILDCKKKEIIGYEVLNIGSQYVDENQLMLLKLRFAYVEQEIKEITGKEDE